MYKTHKTPCSDNLTLRRFELQLKEKAIYVISPDFDNQWNGILKEAERKLLRLLLKVTEKNYLNREIEFNVAVQNTFPKRLFKKNNKFRGKA